MTWEEFKISNPGGSYTDYMKVLTPATTTGLVDLNTASGWGLPTTTPEFTPYGSNAVAISPATYDPGSLNFGTDKDKTKGLFGTDLSTDEWKVGLGVGQLGLGFASYLSNKDYMDKQMEGLDQQLAMNRRSVQNKANIMSAFKGGEKKELESI